MGKNFKTIENTFLRVRQDLRLGDKVEAVTRATGIKAVVEHVHGGPCSGCQQRKDWLNGEPGGRIP